MVQKLPNREEVKVEETWNLADLFATEEDFTNSLVEIEKDVQLFAEKYKGKVNSPSIIVEALTDYSAIYEKIVPAGTYASLSLSTDQTNTTAQMRASKFSSLSAKISSELSFLNSELVELPDETISEAI